MKRNRTKRILNMLLTLCMVLTLVPMTAFAADTYTLTIVNGVKAGGGGETSFVCEAGSGFNITANAAPEGKVFDKWVSTVSGVLTSAGNLTTYFTMPAEDVTVTATYKNEPETDTELKGITVNASKGHGWENPALTTAFDREIRSYELNLPLEYYSIYFYLPVQAEGQTITATVDGVALTVNGLQTDSHALIKAKTVFVFTIKSKDGSKTGAYTVTVNRGSGITHDVTVTGGTTETPTPAEGDTVTITANGPAPGKVFDKWTTTDGVAFANASNATTTFKMPTKAVTVTATYKNDPKTDTELENIKVKAYKSGWQNPELDPTFDRGTRSYSLNLTSEYETIYFYLPVQVEGQTITATVDENTLKVNEALYGFQTDNHALTKSKTVFVFTITAKDGNTTDTYTVTVNRESGTTYEVTVKGGTTTTPTPAKGDTVTITANAPATGKVFDKWTTSDGVTFANANSANTTFVMPAKAVTVTATYKDVPVTTYAVTVNSGTGGGNFAAGATVSITANAPATGKVFDKWTTTDGVVFANANNATTTFTMPAKAVTVTATYKDAPVTTYAVAVNSGTGGGNFAAGAAVSITAGAPATGKVFDKWTTTDGVAFANANTATTTFVMPAKAVTVTATYKDAPVTTYAVTVNSGTGGGNFAAGATVSITANAPATGKVFDKWTTSDGVTFGDANSANTTFRMPAKAVTVTATYKDAAVVVKTALTDAITAANNNKSKAVVSVDGKDVDPAKKWVTTEVMTAYEGAIAAAQTIADNADATQTEVDDAKTALATATGTFNDAKADGTKPAAVVKTALTDAITAANNNKDTAVVSTDGSEVDPAKKWVTTEVMTAYTDAIAAAQTVVENADATQAEVDAAVKALGTATTTFDTAKADGTKPAPTYAVTVTGGTGSGNFAEGATVTITANTPATGKVFDKWTTSDGVAFANANSATATFVMPAKAVTVTATYKDISSETPDYKIIAGESGIWKKDNTKGIVIISNGDYGDFTGVKVDDIFIDPSNYTSAAGSTVVTLKPAYLETLAAGTHIVTLQFGDYSVQTNLTILADEENPKTGDSNHTLPLIGLLLLSGSALIGVTRNKKKKKSYNK